MDGRPEDFEKFLDWIQTCVALQLMNEADVETKFVLPLFLSLGYPDGCRHGQYSLKGMYEPGKRGSKPKIDQIYFSTTERNEQNPDTALVIVEAKASDVADLDAAADQARFYGDRMTPLMLVVTNGRRFQVIKRHRFRGEEIIVDTDIAGLGQDATASLVFEQLHFTVLTRLKKQLIDPVSHAQYVHIVRSMERQPDLEAQLARGDFVPNRIQEGRRLTIVTPKVAVECDLPLAYGDGSSRISFSSLLLRGLTCHLTHRQILESLVTGLDTAAAWGTRRFLRKGEGDDYVAQLGQTSVVLTPTEAAELCRCVDAVGSAYRDIIVAAEETLKTWDYLLSSLPGYHMHAFELVDVEPWLWERMHHFARDFDFLEGTSPWHIFDANNVGFRVMTGRDVESAQLYPHFGPPELPRRDVEVLYCIDEDGYLAALDEDAGLSWKQRVGPKGRWTAQYTQRWLLKRFIPTVLAHYGWQPVNEHDALPYWSFGREGRHLSTLASVRSTPQFSLFLHRIQSWFHHYGDCHIAAASLRPLYAALTDIVQSIDANAIASHYVRYIHGYVLGATRLAWPETDFEPEMDEPDADTSSDKLPPMPDLDEAARSPQEVAQILAELQEHVTRIGHVDYEHPRVADFLVSAFIGLVEHGRFHTAQHQLNAVKEALRPLLEMARFEDRYVLRPPWE